MILAVRSLSADLGGGGHDEGKFLSPVIYERQGGIGPGEHSGVHYSPTPLAWAGLWPILNFQGWLEFVPTLLGIH